MNKRYQYSAVTATGERVSGFIQAANKARVAASLRVDDLYLIRCRRKIRFSGSPWAADRDLHVLHDLSSNLVLLLRARLTLVQALTILSDANVSRTAELCGALLSSLKNGSSLSAATYREVNIFGQVYPALIAVGEVTGHLVDVLDDLRISVEHQIEARDKTRQILVYPMLVGIALAGVILFLLVHVVPQLTEFIESAGGVVPSQTRVLILLSNAFQEYWFQGVVFISSLVVMLGVLYRSSPRVGSIMDRYVLRLPLIGPVVLKLKLSRFCHHMALLGKSNVNLLDAMSVAQPLLNNRRLERAVHDVRLQVLEGCALAEAFQLDDVFPKLFVSLVEIGEASGELTSMFQHISHLYYRDAKTSIGTVQQLVGPGLIACVGGLLVWIIVSVLSPVYETVIGVGAQFP